MADPQQREAQPPVTSPEGFPAMAGDDLDKEFGKCTSPVPHPYEFNERIERYVDKFHEEQPWGPSWVHVHTRLHEVFDRMVKIDPQSATWKSAWAAVVMECDRDRQEADKEEKARAWEFEDGKSIRWRPTGISLVINRGKHDLVLPVISGYLKPVQRVIVEGWTYHEVFLTPSQRVTASAKELLDRLERDGRIRKKKLGHDVLVEVLNEMAPESGVAYPTYGIYATPTGELEIASRAVPVRDEQLSAHESIAIGLEYQPTREDLQAYAEFLTFFNPYEVLAAMGLSGIAPVTHTLRANDVFVPHLWNWSLAHGLGKTLVTLVFGREVWGRPETTGSGINSEFRLSAHLDAANAPLAVDEAESLNVQRLGPDLKTSAERPIVTRRGNTILSMVPFSSRCSLLCSGNRLAPRSGPSLSRWLAPRFDSGKLLERRTNKPQVDQTVGRMRPVGHVLAEQLVRIHPRLESLLQEIRDTEAAISALGAGEEDIRRAQAWATVYVGLQVWEAAFRSVDVAWKVPPVAEFVREVVVPVDQMTYSAEETIVDAFRSWFSSWRVRNVRKVTKVFTGRRPGGNDDFQRDEEIAGQGDLFEDGEIELGERRIHGWYITKPLIADYNRVSPGDLHVGSLAELAAAAADEAGIPHDQVLDPDGKVKRVDFSQRGRARAAFVPREKAGE